MQRYRRLHLIVLPLALAGCATMDDLRRVHGDLSRQIEVTNERVVSVEKGIAPIRDGLKSELTGRIAEEMGAVRKEIARTGEAIPPLRRSQAEGRAEVTEIREQLQQLRGSLEALRRDVTASTQRTTRREDEEKSSVRERLDGLAFKVNFLENFLGIGQKPEAPEPPAEKAAKQPPAAREPAAGAAKSDRESLYSAAYALFKEGKYEKSREAFEHFLKLHPDTEFSDNAQFWIGECYYFEKKYEKAIVEYDKVTKNYPQGNKYPFALLKQGLSFLNLGDKASARLLLQQVVKDYPNTSQARIARAKLLEIK